MIVIFGVFFAFRAMYHSLTDVLAVVCITLGVYMSVWYMLEMVFQLELVFVFSILFFLLGVAVVIVGVHLWIGYTYNVVRIRLVSLGVVFAVLVVLYFYFIMREDLMDWINRAWTRFPILIMGMALFVASSDRTLGFVAAGREIGHTARAIGGRMYIVNDAYLLRVDAEAFAANIQAGKGDMVAVLRSNRFGPRRFGLRFEDGKPLMEISRGHHTYADPEVIREVVAVYLRDTEMTVYAAGGHWFRILVFDDVQENFDLPKILGREWDIAAFVERISKKMSK